MPPTPTRTTSSASGSASASQEDEELRPYIIVSDIGKGSFATVYKGYHEDNHQSVAIKTVLRQKLSAKLFENLQSEIQILKSLSHRHITKLIDIVRTDRNIYLIMEYCSGGDLTNYIKKRGRVETLEYVPAPGAAPQYYPHPRTGGLAEPVVRSFLRQLARALKFLRHRNLIHRDVKPQNLLLCPAPAAELARGTHPLGVPLLKVADFGFARSLPNAMMAETLCGSPLYMAPEILRYQKYDAKADLWSVGAVLYEMAVGRPPFRAANHIELLKKIEAGRGVRFPDEADASTKSNPTSEDKPAPTPVPSDVKTLIRALLKQNPAERASFEEFFGSVALARSKFPRQSSSTASPAGSSADVAGVEGSSAQGAGGDGGGAGPAAVPPHHLVIPPEVLDPNAMIPPSKFRFRDRERPVGAEASPSSGSPPSRDSEPPTEKVRRPSNPSSTIPINHSPLRPPRALERDREGGGGGDGEGSYIPGETEEDGILRREYVLVGDGRAVEFNRAVDELSAVPRRPLHDRRTPSSATPTPTPGEEYPEPPSPQANLTANGNGNGNHTSFPPPQYPGTMPPPPPPPLSSSPSSIASRAASNALNRALSLASKKLFGAAGRRSSSASRNSHESVPPSPRRAIIALGDGDGGERERDPLEDELLAGLEELAQKTFVLTHWADEMYEYVKAVPQKPLPDPTKFTKRAGEADKHARRRKHADMEAEYNAVTCVAVYMLLMSFCQKGINKLRNHQEHMRMRHPDGDFVVSEGFDDAQSWFTGQFVKCYERATLVKTWLPAQYDGPKSWLDQLVYDRALLLSRTAARKELFDQATSPDECEKLYDESLWCLYALQDDLLQTGNPFMDEDRTTIDTWIKRTKLRLLRCRARMAMNDQDRLNDARADHNLADVARIPAPWDVKPADAAVPPAS
ncbi:other/ULK/ULK protein kinase [Mycena albidolilacea]|uniref:non-specific serine/threonine protein kinase n=1 Tax=Mycena albidolilacea TaxID=1033008 RepID=A0AAD7ELQ4_9AGAR|nr:other/ULK/ULK protein kinase [Mycena albidolilacea]